MQIIQFLMIDFDFNSIFGRYYTVGSQAQDPFELTKDAVSQDQTADSESDEQVVTNMESQDDNVLSGSGVSGNRNSNTDSTSDENSITADSTTGRLSASNSGSAANTNSAKEVKSTNPADTNSAREVESTLDNHIAHQPDKFNNIDISPTDITARAKFETSLAALAPSLVASESELASMSTNFFGPHFAGGSGGGRRGFSDLFSTGIPSYMAYPTTSQSNSPIIQHPKFKIDNFESQIN
jgi:hypothetical protein